MPKMAMMSLMGAGAVSLATASYILGRYGWPRSLVGRRSGESAQDMPSLHHADQRTTPSWFPSFGRASKTDINDRLSSGNLAFDEYRADTLKRLEEEQAEFSEFLARLHRIKDDKDFQDFRSRQ